MKKLQVTSYKLPVSFISLFLLSACCFFPSVLFAQKQQKIEVQTNVFTKNFKVNAKDQLVVDTRHTEVTFQEWDKNEIEFISTITIRKATEEDLETVINDYIKITHSQIGKKISYSLTKKGSTIKKWNNIINNTDLSLLIKIPKDIFLEMTSSFGDVDIQTLHNDFKADISYADLIIDKLLGENNTIKIRFGKIKLEQANNISLDIQYSDGILKDFTGRLVLNSRFSTIKIDKAHIIDLTSGYDNITIRDNVDNIEGRMEFGKLKIKSLRDACIFKRFSYSDIIIDEVLPSFTNITFFSSFSNLTLNVPRNQSFAFDYYGSFTIFKDKNIKMTEASVWKEGSTTFEISGVYGKMDSGKKIEIEASHGTVSLFKQ
jgi:hypothetical protein